MSGKEQVGAGLVSSMIVILAVAHAILFQVIKVRHRASKDPGSYPVLKHVVGSLQKRTFSTAGFECRMLAVIRIKFEFMASKLLCCTPQLKVTILLIKGTAPVIASTHLLSNRRALTLYGGAARFSP